MSEIEQPSPDKHKAVLLDTYLRAHQDRMDRFRRDGLIGHDTIESVWFGPTMIIAGEIALKGRIVITVLKFLASCNDDPHNPMVQTYRYSYNVSVQGRGTIFRYDNQHLREEHSDPHHKHTFDWNARSETDSSPDCVGAHGWPTLSEVIEEAITWHQHNYCMLQEAGIDPEAFPDALQPPRIPGQMAE